jgi:hypothetical protein
MFLNMTRTKLVIGTVIGLVMFGGVASAAYVRSTLALYQHGVPCYKLSGVAGFLQATHFLPVSNCAVNQDGTCASENSQCIISNPTSGPIVRGTCASQRLPTSRGGGSSFFCSCQASN